MLGSNFRRYSVATGAPALRVLGAAHQSAPPSSAGLLSIVAREDYLGPGRFNSLIGGRIVRIVGRTHSGDGLAAAVGDVVR
jgi:hypothetical protein